MALQQYDLILCLIASLLPLISCQVQEIRLTMCHGLGFTHTALPNSFGHETQEQIWGELSAYENVTQAAPCFGDFRRYLCSLHLPLCNSPTCEDMVQIPCRSLCFAAQASCEPYLNSIGMTWPSRLDCGKIWFKFDCLEALVNATETMAEGVRPSAQGVVSKKFGLAGNIRFRQRSRYGGYPMKLTNSEEKIEKATGKVVKKVKGEPKRLEKPEKAQEQSVEAEIESPEEIKTLTNEELIEMVDAETAGSQRQHLLSNDKMKMSAIRMMDKMRDIIYELENMILE